MLALRIISVIITAVALVVNAVIHLALAGPYDAITGTLLGQGDLFRIQAAVGIVIAVLLLVTFRGRRAALVVALAAAVVAAGGLTLVVVTALVPLDLTAIGLPSLYEPIWFADKMISVVAQAIALASALLAAVLARRPAPGARR
ncbi:MAG: hypothetical protein Q7J04_02165 [Microcella sp.]|nr:hypothetical protein [Microcella sp.]